MKPFEPRTQALLRATRNADEPSDEQVDRVHGSLLAKIAAGGAVAAGLQTVSTSATGAASSTFAAKLALLPMAVKVSLTAAVLGLGTLGGYKLVSSAHDSHQVAPPAATIQSVVAPAPEIAPTAATPQPAQPPEVKPLEEEHASSTSSSAHGPGRSPRPSQITGPALQEEARLLADVQSALGAGQGAKALDKLNEYDQRFSGGVLRAEADAARVFALCQSGRRADAQAAARRFLKRYPSSPSASRVQQACADPGSTPKAAQ
jgi:hypothetical protein